MPVMPNCGAHMYLEIRHDVFGKALCRCPGTGSAGSSNLRPASSTPTRYPFSVSRRAATLPPNPEPITRTS